MNTLIHRVRRLLEPQVLAAIVVTVAVEIGLAVTTVPRTARLLGIRMAHSDATVTACGGQLDEVVWIGRRAVAVHRVLRHWPFGDTCLRRALVLGQRIRRLAPELVIGVRHDDAAGLAAHAWLVVHGVALDPLAAGYAPLQDRNRAPGR